MHTPAQTRDLLIAALGRRGFLRAAGAVTAAGSAAALAAGGEARAAAPSRTPYPREILQPGRGPIDGDHYLPSLPDQIRWGYLPSVDAEPVLRIRSGETVTVDSVSHEGLLEDQGRDPVAYFGGHEVPAGQVLSDAVAIARDYARAERDFDADGPHVITGPIHVAGAEPGDVLKVEPLSLLPRVPYGVISSRHGKGALARQTDGGAPAGITAAEVMPPVATDGRPGGDPAEYGNVSVFTAIRRGRGGALNGVLPLGSRGEVTFPLGPHMGTMGVAFAAGEALNAPELNSIPPNLGGGNIDINLLRQGSAFYLPVFAEGALFYTGDPHFAMADGEVALTAVEGSLRTTFRLTVCKPGSGDAPSVAFRYPFGETADAWLPVGLSDPDGGRNGQVNDLDTAMRRAVVNALDFLEHDLGMDRAVAYAYLSAAADFHISQVVDRTVGVHAVIDKGHFGGGR
ncbi:acetamidase/formamidase family protein [Streptomyces litchfieldiae]|uniref:Acetamidase/formamidase family protein n=1 Tax=Streptomyces litchfieldiae TaxID=3075543 RepID=A0ABU2MW11_9ACTN|nr:acetamidase/formamidase family protein [Streptomyces sp. DSM 44938]MDT0345784.1 acetamidase/formamidase family protein [Streptomyces sp. DSM 44938]